MELDKPPRIFLSSTNYDLHEYREEAKRIFRVHNLEYYAQEDFVDTGRRNDPVCFSREEMNKCNAYVGIIAFRYGYIPDGNEKSVTHEEYDYACQLMRSGKFSDRVFVLIASVEDDFAGDGAIYTMRDPRPETEEAFAKDRRFHQFRELLKKEYSSIFRSRADFKEKLNKLLRTHYDEKHMEVLDNLLNKHVKLRVLVHGISSKSEQARLALAKVDQFKSLHDLVHLFRQQVLRKTSEVLIPRWHMLDREQRQDMLDEYHDELIRVEARLSPFAADAGRVQADLSFIQNHKGLYRQAGKADDTEQFRRDFKDLTAAFEMLFNHFNYALKEASRELDGPTKDVISQLRAPAGMDSADENAWMTALDRLEGAANRLLNAIDGHDFWQHCHDQLVTVDEKLRALEDSATEPGPESPERVGILRCYADDWLSIVHTELAESTCEVQLLIAQVRHWRRSGFDRPQTKSVEKAAALVGDNDSQQLEQTLTRFCDCFGALPADQRASIADRHGPDRIGWDDPMDLERAVTLYRDFRNCFDDVFFQIDLQLKDRCKVTVENVKGLLSLLQKQSLDSPNPDHS